MKADEAPTGPGPDRAGPAADAQAPYVRVAAVGLIHRNDGHRTSEGREGRDAPDDPGRRRCAPGGRWLLLHRGTPVDAWDPPGGRMERGEDLTTAVVREVAEETGLAVQVSGPCYALLTVYKGERLLAVSMACRPISDPDRLTMEPDGAGEWRWVSSEEWECLAAEGRSTWDANDVKKATRMATVLWEAEGE